MMTTKKDLILTIDTATATSVVGLVRAGHLVAERRSADSRRADDTLNLVAALLNEVGSPLTAIDQIVVRRGVGSYTGLRVGVTIANTLGWSLGRPVTGVLSRRLGPVPATVLANRAAPPPVPVAACPWRQVTPAYRRWQVRS